MLPLKKHKRSRGRHASLPHWPCVVLDIMSASLARYDHRVYSGVSRLSRVQFFDILLCKSAIRRLFFPPCSIAVYCTLSRLFVLFGLDSGFRLLCVRLAVHVHSHLLFGRGRLPVVRLRANLSFARKSVGKMSVTAYVTYERRVEKPRVAWASEDERKERLHWFYITIWMLLWQVASFTLWHLRPVLNKILRCQIIFRGGPNFHLQDAMSGSTRKKPVSSRAKKRNNDRPSVADFCRLCKCSFKTVYGKIFLIRPVEMAKKEILSNQFALATSDVQSILETDEIHMEDRNHGLAAELSRTMAYTTLNTVNRTCA